MGADPRLPALVVLDCTNMHKALHLANSYAPLSVSVGELCEFVQSRVGDVELFVEVFEDLGSKIVSIMLVGGREPGIYVKETKTNWFKPYVIKWSKSEN